MDTPKKAKRSTKRKAKKSHAKGRRKSATKRPKPSVEISKHGNQIDLDFYNVRKIEKKLDLIKSVPNAEFRKRMKKGKPPKAAVIIVTLSDGRTHAVKTPPDFVVNTINIKAFIEGITTKMKDDYTEWLDLGRPNLRKYDKKYPRRHVPKG